MKNGLDASVDLTNFGACLAGKGYDFVGRYYTATPKAKTLTMNEAVALSKAGLAIVAIWEDGAPTNIGYFSYDIGVQDGKAAYDFALTQINQPQLTPIYFTVDYDASKNDLNGAITDYFKGIQDGFNAIGNNIPLYLVGIYGSGLACQTIMAANLAGYSWLAGASGWQGYATYTSYNIAQADTILECVEVNGGVIVDRDQSPKNNEGSFSVGH